MNDMLGNGTTPRTVDAGRGAAWWSEGWALFVANAGMWVVLGLLLMVIFVVLAFIPLLGSIASALLMPVFIGSWMLAVRRAGGGGTPAVENLFVCFKNGQTTPLIVLGALLLGASIVITIVAGGLGFGAAAGMIAGGQAHSTGGLLAATGAGLLVVLISLAMGFVVAMALWFAPALVVFQNMAPVDALKASVAASLKNVVPFLVYGLIYVAAAIVASIPFGLGWVVLVPLLLITMYVSYEDLFGI